MHTHHHQHHHGSGKLLVWAVIITLAFAVVEAIGGWLAGSLALLGDAAHMMSDATALGIAALAAWLAQRSPSKRHSYGFGRAEVIAALVNGILMLAIVAGIAIAAIHRFQSPAPVSGGTVMLIATIGLIVNLILAFLLSRTEQTLNVRGAMLHVIGDLLGSVAALIAGTVVYFTNWTPIDPLLSLFICLLIAVSAVRLIRDSLHVVMEGVPTNLSLEEVGLAIAEISDVRSVHDLHIWTLSSGHTALSAHVVIDDMGAWQSLLPHINQLLGERFDIKHTTIQPECTTHVLRPATELASRQRTT